MSRERERKRQKKDELARQLAGQNVDGDKIAERARTTRPALHLLQRTPTQGLLRRLLTKESPLTATLFLVDGKGARAVASITLDDRRHELAKVSYHRPAHFVLVVVPGVAGVAGVAAVPASATVDGIALGDAQLAAVEWEQPRAVRVAGLDGADTGGVVSGAVVSLRGVARIEARLEFPLEDCVATILVEV